jgi:tRNA1(Val) A37 N6-methylase TrmN6
MYPNHDWLEWKFQRAAKNFWDDIENQKKFFEHLAKAMGVTSMEQWYKVSTSDVRKHGGMFFCVRPKTLSNRCVVSDKLRYSRL